MSYIIYWKLDIVVIVLPKIRECFKVFLVTMTALL